MRCTWGSLWRPFFAEKRKCESSRDLLEGAVTTDISIDFISANSVQIEWSGTLASGDDRLYYPLRLDVEDRAGFTQAFDVQVPILSDTAIA